MLRRFALPGIVLLFIAIRLTSDLVEPHTTQAFALPSRLADGLTLALSVLIESLPFVFLGVLLSTVVQVWVPARFWARILPGNAFARRVVLSFLGVLLPVCECGNVPLARGLLMRGFSTAESLTFLLAAPIINPVTILTTYQAFGWDDGILVARIVGAFLIAQIVGWIFDRHPRPEQLLVPSFRERCRHTQPANGSTWHRSLTGFVEEVRTMLPALTVGSAIAGAIQVGVPRAVLTALGTNPVWSVLALVALAFVISICSNVDSFFILSLSSTFMPGSIVAFLIFGAMLDIKMLALLSTTFTARLLAVVGAVVALACVCIGWGMNLVI